MEQWRLSAVLHAPDLLGGTMPTTFADYRFTNVPLASIFDTAAGTRRKEVARVFFGEWMKLLPDPAKNGFVKVRYRGGEGWVDQAQIGTTRCLEVFFIDVGQGDSILIQTPQDRRVLIDGGPGDQALKFIENKYRLDKKDNNIDFEAVIATHSDSDHTKGLIKILQHPKIGVRRVYHNGLFPGLITKNGNRACGLVEGIPAGSGLAPMMQQLAAAIRKASGNLPRVLAAMQKAGRNVPSAPASGTECRRADYALGHVVPFAPGAGDVGLEILWPQATVMDGVNTYPWYCNDEGKTKNGNSVVLLLTHGRNRVLLAGDLNADSMKELASVRAAKLDADVYKAAHHGSQDYDLPFLQAVRPNAAVIMSGDDKYSVYGHPRAVLLGTITKYSKCSEPGVFSTELAGCYTPLKGKDLASFKKSYGQLYAKSIQGVIHLRSDGDRMFLGRSYGRAMPEDPVASTTWKFDVWPR